MCFYMANILHFYIPNSTNEAQIYGPREYETVFRIVSSRLRSFGSHFYICDCHSSVTYTFLDLFLIDIVHIEKVTKFRS